MMKLDFTRVNDIYIICGKTDMRLDIDNMATLIQESYNLNPYSDSIFLFCGNRKGRYKCLYFDGDGFVMLYNRLDDGRLRSPKSEEDVRNVSQPNFRELNTHFRELTLLFRELATRFRELTLLFRELATHFRELTLLFRELATRFRELATRFRELSLHFRELTLRFRELTLRFRELTLRFRELAPRFRELAPHFRELTSRFRELTSRFRELTR
ncbi:MAG: IS66 family insertion sequence element accessory protein TnpB [Bacilli bacterium]